MGHGLKEGERLNYWYLIAKQEEDEKIIYLSVRIFEAGAGICVLS